MENKPRKSKALIITIIVIIFLVVVSYLLFKNRDMFGVKTSNSIARIFAPLITSENEKNISKIDENSVRTLAQAGEDLEKGDNVTRFGTNADNNPIVVKSKQGDEIFGFAGNDMGGGELGEIITNNNGANTFWNSFFNLIGGVFGTNGNNGGGNGGNGDFTRQCSDTLDNDNDGLIDTSDPECHTDGDPTNPDSYDPEHYSETTFPGGGGDYKRQCSDTLDNDNDGLTDTSDPECHTDGDPTNPDSYDPEHYSETTFPGGGDYKRQCEDTLDNDNDGLIDASDSGCHIDGDLNKDYVPNHYSEAVFPGEGGNTRQCSDTLDNDNDGLIDTSDPECHTDGDATNPLSYDPEHYSEKLGAGGNEEDGTPDLTASSVTPTTASINVPVNLTTIITNIGDGSTGFNFVSFFQIIKDSNIDVEDGDNTTVSKLNIKNIFVKILNKISLIKKAVALTGDINTTNGVEITAVVPTLTAQKSNVTSVSYTFSSAGVYKIRACADKKSISDVGTVEESNEENNCSGWTTLTVSGSLPPPGDDEIIIPDDDTTIPEPPIEIEIPENKCLLIEQNPLVFTDTEKAKLAELLRKFYLISSTLKTEEDIITVYSEIDQYKNFIAQTDGLINTCYKEVAEVKAKGGDGGWVQNGNPWYRPAVVGSVPFGNENPYLNYNLLEGGVGTVTINGEDHWGGEGCKYISGYLYGGKLVTDAFTARPEGVTVWGKEGDDCDSLNDRPFKCAAINSNLYGYSSGGAGSDKVKAALRAGCKWKEGVYLDGVERVLELW